MLSLSVGTKLAVVPNTVCTGEIPDRLRDTLRRPRTGDIAIKRVARRRYLVGDRAQHRRLHAAAVQRAADNASVERLGGASMRLQRR